MGRFASFTDDNNDDDDSNNEDYTEYTKVIYDCTWNKGVLKTYLNCTDNTCTDCSTSTAAVAEPWSNFYPIIKDIDYCYNGIFSTIDGDGSPIDINISWKYNVTTTTTDDVINSIADIIYNNTCISAYNSEDGEL